MFVGTFLTLKNETVQKFMVSITYYEEIVMVQVRWI